jgi:probable phosphoglycerate mutase
MEKLILVRHGETAKNIEGKLHATEDAERLTEVGIAQIAQTAQRLKDYAPAKVYASIEARAIQSGEIIARALGVACESIEGLHERDWGTFSGKPWSEVQKILSSMNLEERYEYTPPGGESWKQFEGRLIHAINMLMGAHPNQNIIVVSHGGAIRALMPYFLRLPREESFNHNPDNASITVFRKSDGIFTPELMNDTNHLRPRT